MTEHISMDQIRRARAIVDATYYPDGNLPAPRGFNRHTGDASCACQIEWTIDARSAESVIDLASVAPTAPMEGSNAYTQLFAEGGFYVLCLDEYPFGTCTIQCAQPRGHEGHHRFDCHTWEQR